MNQTISMRKTAITIGRNICLAKAVILLLCIGLSCAAQTHTPHRAPASQVKTIAAIGQDIANLKAKFPQLREFSVAENVRSERLIIAYEYHTHPGRRWDSGPATMAEVPQPDDDGVWLLIEFYDPPTFHDPPSTDQIHTQPTWPRPGSPPDCLEDKEVSFVMLEGKKTSPASGEIWEILKRHGVKPCTAPAPASQVKVIAAIGQDIAKLNAKFPQLSEFSVSKNVLSERLIIDYNYHTRWYHTRHGSRALVPEPDDDGVVFYIDFHDPASRSQNDNQPGDPQDCFEDKEVQFRILQGQKTNPVADEIRKILERHGVKPCAGRTPQRKRRSK